MYKFKIPIGDWSGDGHEKTHDYLIKSNKSLQEVRELYFQACEKLGFSLDGNHKLTPCNEYHDYLFKLETILSLKEFGVIITEDEVERWTKDFVETEEFCDLILRFIKTQDLNLELEIIPSENFPMFQFYEHDDKKRHIGFFGYGLFD